MVVWFLWLLEQKEKITYPLVFFYQIWERKNILCRLLENNIIFYYETNLPYLEC